MAEVTITSPDGSTRVEDGKGNVIRSTPAPSSKKAKETVTVSTSSSSVSKPVYIDEKGNKVTKTIRGPTKTVTKTYTREASSAPAPAPQESAVILSKTLPEGAVRVGESRIRYQGLTYSEKDFYAMQARGQGLGVQDAPNREELVYKSKLTSIIGDYGEYNEQTGELSLYAPKGSEAYGYISGVLMAAPKGYVVEETKPGVFFIGKADYSKGQSGYELVRDKPAMGAGGGGSGGGAPSISSILSPYGGKTALPQPYIEKVSAIPAARAAAADSLGIGTNTEVIGANTLLMRYALKKEGSSLLMPAPEQGYSEGGMYFTPQKVNPSFVIKAGLFEAGRDQAAAPKPGTIGYEKAQIAKNVGAASGLIDAYTFKPQFDAGAKFAEATLGGWAGEFTGNFITGVRETVASGIMGGAGVVYFGTKMRVGQPISVLDTPLSRRQRLEKAAASEYLTERAGSLAGSVGWAVSSASVQAAADPLGTYAGIGKWGVTVGIPKFAAAVGVGATVKAGASALSGFRQTIGGIEYGLTYKEGSILSKTAASGERVMFAYGPTYDMSLAYGSKGVSKGPLVGVTTETPLSKGFFFQETYKVVGGEYTPIGANILGPEGGRLYNIPGGFESPNIVARGYNAVKINNIGVGGFADDAFYSYADDLAYSNLGGFDKYAKALSYTDEAIGGRTLSPVTEETRYLLSDTLGKEGWKGAQYMGYQFKGQGVTLDTADDILTFSTGRPTPYLTQSYAMKAGEKTQVFLGTVQTGEGAFRFQGYNINVENLAPSAQFGGVMKASGFFDDVTLGAVKAGEGTSQFLKGAAVRAFTPPPALLNLQRGGSAVVSATKTVTLQPQLVLPRLGTQQKPAYDTKLYDGAYSVVEAPRIGGITEQKVSPAIKVKPVAATKVGLVGIQGFSLRSSVAPKLKVAESPKVGQMFRPAAIFKPLSGQETKVSQIQSLKVSPLTITKQFISFDFEKIGGGGKSEPPPPDEGGGGGGVQFQFSQFAFPGISRVQDKSAEQGKGYRPSILGRLMGFTAKKAPSKVFRGSEIRPVVIPKVKMPTKKKRGWWFF